MRAVVIAVLLAAVAAWAWTSDIDRANKTAADQATRYEKDAMLVAAASQLNDQWKETFEKTGKPPERQDLSIHRTILNQLALVQADSPSYREASFLRQQFSGRQMKVDEFEVAKRKRQIADDASGRKRFAEQLDLHMLKSGYDMSVTASGAKNTTLKVYYILLNRPLVYKLTNEGNFLSKAWDAGFRTVRFENGQTFWSYDAPK